MARQLAQRNVAKLKLASAGHSFDWLQWNLSDRKAVALPILRRRGGLLVAVPSEAITAEEADTAIVGEEITDLGPTQRTEVSATMAGDEAEEPPFLVEVLLLDVPTAKFSTFSIVAGPAGILEDCFHFGADAQLIPDAGELTAAAREWVQQGGSHSEAYLTAIEADRPARAAADPMALVLDQLGSLSSALQTLQGDVARLQATGSAQPAAEVPPPLAMGALAKARQVVGPPPRTTARPTVPEVEELGPAEEVDMNVADPMNANPEDLDQMMRVALLQVLQAQTRKQSRKSKLPGLPTGDDDSESDLEDGDSLRRLAGAKGTMLQEKLKKSMDAKPGEYVKAIELMAAQAVGQTVSDASSLERFVREELPVGTDKTLGHLVWALTKICHLLRSSQPSKAHLVALLALASVEQFRLDGSWTTAWRLTQLQTPPFAEWMNREPNLQALRSEHAHSRLVHPTWAAAVVARLRDEETLVKRRERLPRPTPNPKPSWKGRGRGGKGSQASGDQQAQD